MRFSIFQDTDIGARSINQDRMGYCFTRESVLMVVADGMGGHARGEVAAQLTLQVCAGHFQRMATPRLADPARFLEAALNSAHRELLSYQSLHQLPEAPRTTVVACIVQDDGAWWAHAGDSRLYWLRDGAVMARTIDHSRVQALMEMGLVSPEEERTHPDRNKVLNCLGSPQEPSIELSERAALMRGDVLLLCSDGFWSGVSEPQFASLLRHAPVDAGVPELVRQAVAQGGRIADNTTVVAMAWEGAGENDLPTLSAIDLPDGAITTTIAFGRPEQAGAVAPPLTDEDIERQIADIQRAIRRSHDPHHRES